MQHQNPETVTLNDILITEELSRRAPRPPDLQAENQAMRMLIHRMTQDAQSLMQTLVDTALELCQAGTTGLSLLETTADGEEIFRWNALAGTLAHHVGGSTPRNFSPCGVCLDQGVPVLFSHPERYFTYFQKANTPVVEGLVLPLVADSHVFGTIWIMSHNEGQHFDSEDVRVMTSLADFTATALLLQHRQTGELLAANAVLETEIVERKQVEAQTHALIANLPGGAVFVIDRDLRYLLAEGEALAAAGFKSEDFVERTIFEVLPPDLVASYEPIYRKALAGEPFEHEHNAHNHTYISRGTPLRSENGEVYAVMAVSYDITERKRAEAALRESEENYRSLFSSIDEGYLLCEVIFDENEEPIDILYLEANPAAIRLAGRDFSGRRMREIDPNYEEYWYELIGHVVTTGESVRAEHYAQLHGRWFDFHASKVGGPESRRVASIFQDTTERKLRERQQEFLLKLSDALRTETNADDVANRAVGMLLEQMSLDRCYIGVYRLEENRADLTHQVGNERVPPLPERIRLSDFPEALRVTFDRTLMIEDIAETEGLSDTDRQNIAALGFRALVAATLRKGENKPLWAIVAVAASPRCWTRGEIALVEEVAERTWAAVERARAEESLTQSEAKYRSLFNSIDNGFCIIERVPGEQIDFRYLEANPAFAVQTGIRDVVGKTIREVVPGVSEGIYEIYENVLQTGEPIRSEIDVSSLDRILEVYAFRIGDEPRLAVIFKDISDRKRLEQRQAYILQLSDALRSLSDAVEIQATVTRITMNFFGIDRCYYCEIIDGDIIIRRDAAREDLPTVVGVYPLENSPLFKAMLDAGQPFAVEDVYTTNFLGEDLRQACFQLQIISFILVPVIKQGEPVGILSINQTTPRNWTAFEVDLAEEIAERTWAAVERARAEAAVEADLRATQMLHNLATRLISEEDRQALYQEIVKTAIALTQADAGSFQILDETTQELVIMATQGVDQTMAEHFHRLDASSNTSCGIALTTGERTFIHFDVPESEDPDGSLRIHKEAGFCCVQSTPLRSRSGKPIGMFSTHWREDHQLSDRELRFLDLLARQAADIIEQRQAEENRIQLIHEQTAREQERQRAETLAELDRTKTNFFSNISHEFRTPLTLSLAPLQDALSDRTHPLDPVHRERLELVHRNSLRLLKLVNTLLDFSRIEAGRRSAVYEPTDLATFTTELASVFRSAIEQAGLQLIVDCPPLPEPVFVDREMWEKIVLNLLSNAFKFTFEGEIRVSLYSTDRNQAILQVRDSGTGIAPEHLPHLFERFYQVRGTHARTYDGSGIGLALVHELVRLQGGTIEVSSSLGEGTCFTIALPFGIDHLPSERLRRGEAERVASPKENHLHLEGAPRSGSVPDRQPTHTQSSTAMGAASYGSEAERWLPSQNAAFRPPSPPTLGGTGVESPPELGDLGGEEDLRVSSSASPAYVLLVDDNADMREYLTRILSDYVQVEAVADGATALAVAQARVPDLILSDVMMPGLDGFELLGALRADPRTREIPIILLSARAGEEAIVEGLESGADDYLIKPFSAQELISRVTAHLQTAQLRSEALQQERTINRQKDEFISVVSHELNTPLVSILGWTRMLRSSQPNPVMLSKALDTIERNATLQGKLVQDLLDLSRISAGKLRLNPQPIELKPVIETAIATVTQPAADKGIDLTWQKTVTEPVVVMGDSDRLSQVLINLLTNAIKFTPQSGSVTLELSTANNNGSADASYVEIRVSDTGIGIAADFLPHVFERFRQAEGTHSAKGLGLGLAIARHIVELHNGTIHANSAGERQGATFTVRLPLLQDSES